MVDARRFLLNSDFPLDKIVGFMSVQATVANGEFLSQDFPHELPFMPLPVGSWSYQANFDESYPPVLDFNGNGARPNVTIQAGPSVLRLILSNFTGTTRTIYWRAFFLMPAGVSAQVAATASASNRIVFNSDFNYTKLLKQGYTASPTAIPHDLGWLAQVAVWNQRSHGFVEQMMTNDATTSPYDTWAEVTTSGLILSPVGGEGIHWRIYADE